MLRDTSAFRRIVDQYLDGARSLDDVRLEVARESYLHAASGGGPKPEPLASVSIALAEYDRGHRTREGLDAALADAVQSFATVGAKGAQGPTRRTDGDSQ